MNDLTQPEELAQLLQLRNLVTPTKITIAWSAYVGMALDDYVEEVTPDYTLDVYDYKHKLHKLKGDEAGDFLTFMTYVYLTIKEAVYCLHSNDLANMPTYIKKLKEIRGE